MLEWAAKLVFSCPLHVLSSVPSPPCHQRGHRGKESWRPTFFSLATGAARAEQLIHWQLARVSPKNWFIIPTQAHDPLWTLALSPTEGGRLRNGSSARVEFIKQISRAICSASAPFFQKIPALLRAFVDYFFEFAWGFSIETLRGFLVVLGNKAQNVLKKFEKIRGKVRDKNSQKFGEPSHGNFSDLTFFSEEFKKAVTVD